MEQHKDSRFIDDLLDASVAQYRSVESRPGLENRVLAQLRAAPAASRWWGRSWRLGAGLAAVGVVLAVVSVRYRLQPHAPASAVDSPKPASTAEASRTPVTAQAGQIAALRHESRRAEQDRQVARSSRPSNSAAFSFAASQNRRVSEKRNSAVPLALVGPNGVRPGASAARPYEAPRREVFPSPAPLSEEEKLLVSYARQGSDAALAAFREDSQPLASLKVPDLTMPPLERNEIPGITSDQTK